MSHSPIRSQGVLRHVPFALPFDLRVRILRHLIAQVSPTPSLGSNSATILSIKAMCRLTHYNRDSRWLPAPLLSTDECLTTFNESLITLQDRMQLQTDNPGTWVRCTVKREAVVHDAYMELNALGAGLKRTVQVALLLLLHTLSLHDIFSRA